MGPYVKRAAAALSVLVICVGVRGGPAALMASAPPKTARQIAIKPVGATLHVANQLAGASDTNPGTASLPLRTIGAAAKIAATNNAEGVPTTVVIHPGIYRESVAIFGESAAPFVFQAAENGTVILSGSDIWTNWQVWQPGIYRHAWPFRWGMAPIPAHWPAMQDIVRRREMVFINGELLTQVLAQPAMTEGAFYVDEQSGWVYLRPPAGADMASATVEVAIRPSLFKASDANLTIRGLTFEHAATFLDEGAVSVSDGSAILIEDTQYLWNNWGGLGIHNSTNVIVRRSVANHNGGRGMSDWRNKNLLFEDNETSFNNWRGAWGGFFDWAMGGIKNMRAHDGIWRRHKSLANQAYGLWFDSDNQDVVVEDSVFCNNRLPGVFLEASQGPITVTRSTLCNNERDGVFGNGAEQVMLQSNIFYHNGVAQIELGGSEARGSDNWETKQTRQVRDQHWTLCGNVVVSRTPAGDARDQNWGLLAPDWPWFLTTLRSSSNTWWNPQKTTIFHVARLDDLDLAGWQLLTKQDASSTFADPRLSGSDQSSLAVGAGSPQKPC